MKIQLIALKTFPYAGRVIKAGQEFSTSYKNGARVLIRLGNADFAPARAADLLGPTTIDDAPVVIEDAPVAAVEQTAAAPADSDETCSPQADQQPEPAADTAPQPAEEPAAAPPAAAEADAEPPVRPRRAYRRRDMTAEG